MDLGRSTWNCLQCPPAAILNRSGPRKQPVGNQLGWVSHCKERYFIIIIIVATYLQTCAKGDYRGIRLQLRPCLETGVLCLVTECCSPGLSAQHPQALSNLLVTTTTYNQSQNVKDFNEDAIIFTVVWQTLSTVC